METNGEVDMNYITEDSRIYAKDDTGKVIAEVTFPSANGIATIDHTFVDDSLRGQGIAARLVQMAVDKITADGLSPSERTISTIL